MRVLTDAAVLIFLAKANLLEVLKKLYGRVYISDEVLREVLRGVTPEKEAIVKRVGTWIIEVKTNKSEEELEGESKPLGLDPGEYSLALIYKTDDVIILANGRAERKIKENFRCLVKDILEVGREASSASIINMKQFAEAIYRAGYRTRRVRRILGSESSPSHA